MQQLTFRVRLDYGLLLKRKWWILFGLADGKIKDTFGFIDQFLNDFDTRSERGDEWSSTGEELWLAEAVYLSLGLCLQFLGSV